MSGCSCSAHVAGEQLGADAAGDAPDALGQADVVLALGAELEDGPAEQRGIG